MMMKPTVIDFLHKTAEYLVKDRPDLFDDQAHAVAVLDFHMEQMRDLDESGIMIFKTDFFLLRHIEQGVEEWDVARRLSSVLSFDDEDGLYVCSHTADSQTLNPGVDLPGVDEALDM